VTVDGEQPPEAVWDDIRSAVDAHTQ